MPICLEMADVCKIDVNYCPLLTVVIRVISSTINKAIFVQAELFNLEGFNRKKITRLVSQELNMGPSNWKHLRWVVC